MKNESKLSQKLVIIMGIAITTLVVFTFAYYLLVNPSIELFDLTNKVAIVTGASSGLLLFMVIYPLLSGLRRITRIP